MQLEDFVAGSYERCYQYSSFVPTTINHPWVVSDPQVLDQLGRADRALGELNGLAGLVPDIDFCIRTYVAQEATKSSRIEGTQTNIEGAFKRVDDVSSIERNDWQEVQNYIKAIHQAIGQLDQLPVANRLLLYTHRILMQGVRGEHKQPGEFRTSQNWIGGSLSNAVFVPPHHERLPALMGDLELFLNESTSRLPPLLKIAMAHYQFETVHPFLDGNGRLGRLMISLYLCAEGLLDRPALYLSDYFERNKTAYVDHMMAVRDGKPIKEWLLFFLHGVEQTARSSVDVFREIVNLQQWTAEAILPHISTRKLDNARLLIRQLYGQPVTDVKAVMQLCGVTANTAGSLVGQLTELGLLVEITGNKRNRLFVFRRYLDLFQ